MANSLSNQTVVVIGGSNGIGAAVAAIALAEGARAFAISRSGTAVAGAVPVAADVSDPQAIRKALASVGPIDHLVYTAAARITTPALPALEAHALQQTFEIKLFGAIQTIRMALPHLAERASISLTSGQVSRKYGSGTVTKGAVNAAVDAAGRHLAKELAPRRVNVISPGVVDTSLWGEAGSDARSSTIARVASALPVQRVARPEELAAAYLFVMTNGFVTGSVMDVDGGGLL